MPRMDQYDIKAAPTTSDQLLIIDVEDGSQSPQGTTKRATIGTLPGGGGGIQPPAGDIGGTAQAPTVVATHVPALAPTGLTGATAASRYVGATASGAPASGTFLLGDFAVDQTGKIWICTTAGTPGTWTAAGPTIPVTIAQGGTGQITAAAALNALGGAAVAGDIGGTSAAPQVTGTHLGAPLPLAQGGTGQASQQAAIDALAGTQSAGKYLRSDGTHTTLQPLQAADVPQLADYAPTGLTGATAPTVYGGGTVSGHPLTGAWSVGQWVVDQTGKIYVCIASGTPGTWLRVGANPWQFFIDDYAKGDGVVALVNTTAASAVINTTPLGAPAAPTVSNSGTGGTILAGVYQVIVTYVNRWGETVGSAAGSTTTTGTTSTITIQSPATLGNAVGWYAYVTGPGGATFFRQQAPGSPTVIQDQLVLTAPPTATGANPPGADTTAAQVFTSTAVDGGKNVMICGGLGSPGAPWIDTIASVQSPTQATLSSNGAGQGGNATQAGCGMVFASDDRLAIDSCVQAAEAYMALPGSNFVQLVAGNKIYGLGTGLFQSTDAQGTAIGGYGVDYNAQMRLPITQRIISGQESKIEVQLVGPSDNSHGQFWVSQLPNLLGASFVSFSAGPTTPDPLYGQQAVIGGPATGTHHGNNGFANYKAVIDGIQVIHPGWSNSIGIDLQWLGGCRVRGMSMSFAPSTNAGGGVNPSNSWTGNSFWLNKLSAGLRVPNAGNNDDLVVESWMSEGLNNGIQVEADHLTVHRLSTINCDNAVVVESFDANTHDLTINQWSIEACNGGLVTKGGTGHVTCHIVMDGENTSLIDVKDTGNALYGVLYWSDPFRSPAVPTIQGAQNLRVVNCMRGPAVVPAVVPLTFGASIALQADFGNVFTVTLTASTGTLANPTNPQDGQTIRVRVIQDATGGRTLAYGTAYDFGAAGAPVLSTGPNKVDILGFEYVASLSKWVYVGSALGG